MLGTLTEVQKRVRRGADALDAYIPEWVDLVDLARLDVASATECVVGQLCGNYVVGIRTMFGGRRRAGADHGFIGISLRDSVELTEAWRELIARRRLIRLLTARNNVNGAAGYLARHG